MILLSSKRPADIQVLYPNVPAVPIERDHLAIGGRGERISPALVTFARAYPFALERQTAGYRQAVVLESFGDCRIAKPFWPKGRHNKAYKRTRLLQQEHRGPPPLRPPRCPPPHKKTTPTPPPPPPPPPPPGLLGRGLIGIRRAGGPDGPGARRGGQPFAAGSHTVKALPWPGRLSTVTRPPCSATIFFTIARPSPFPSVLWLVSP